MSGVGFPAGVAPGFDPTHLAAKGALFSGIASGGNFINLLTGQPGTINGGASAPSAAMHGIIGPSSYFPNNGNVSFPYAATNWSQQTMAAIVVFDASASTNVRVILSTSATATTGCVLSMGNAGTAGSAWFYSVGGSGIFFSGGFPGGALVAGASYFIVASAATLLPVNVALCRLDNGQMGGGSYANANSFNAGDTTLYIGNRGLNTRQSVGKISAVMHANSYLSLAQLTQWAADPWAFWYPSK